MPDPYGLPGRPRWGHACFARDHPIPRGPAGWRRRGEARLARDHPMPCVDRVPGRFRRVDTVSKQDIRRATLNHPPPRMAILVCDFTLRVHRNPHIYDRTLYVFPTLGCVPDALPADM